MGRPSRVSPWKSMYSLMSTLFVSPELSFAESITMFLMMYFRIAATNMPAFEVHR